MAYKAGRGLRQGDQQLKRSQMRGARAATRRGDAPPIKNGNVEKAQGMGGNVNGKAKMAKRGWNL